MNDYRAFIKTPTDERNLRDHNSSFVICTDRLRDVSGKQTGDHLSTDASRKKGIRDVARCRWHMCSRPGFGDT